MKHSSRKATYRDISIATILLVISLVINIGTLVRTLNEPVQTVVVNKPSTPKTLHGKITGKEMVGKLYTLDCGPYGKFLVNKEQYDSANVGDDIPSYLKGRGN